MYVNVGAGTMCAHLTNDANACDADASHLCEGGMLVEETAFADGSDGFQCIVPELHCLTNDGSSCPSLSPLPPEFCEAGDVVQGAASDVAAADGLECSMPSVHCLTRDGSACPQLSPLPPGFCAGGEVVRGASTFVPSADGMVCQLPSVHCVGADASACG